MLCPTSNSRFVPIPEVTWHAIISMTLNVIVQVNAE